ncbi:hypothetical protein DC366_01165 [Pelagivirga sediminicola]|uniref:NfeD-like C-terminal domain-containing protein n=1 Tax=Pelagivirga sediminicola TaxID=2170575 RepID=A0A2T7GB28_9RHOB|nr:hypothetical protein [Pelagivirga sediminicola]PVA11606.1 hypothetical protein DC366_01165 [Pelagivirga sediminicola]
MIEVVETVPLWALWWAWLVAALLFAIIEIVLPGFLFLGFALGAAAVGFLLIFAPLALGLPLLLVLFAALSLGAWAALRRMFRLRNGQVRRVKGDVNKG